MHLIPIQHSRSHRETILLLYTLSSLVTSDNCLELDDGGQGQLGYVVLVNRGFFAGALPPATQISVLVLDIFICITTASFSHIYVFIIVYNIMIDYC